MSYLGDVGSQFRELLRGMPARYAAYLRSMTTEQQEAILAEQHQQVAAIEAAGIPVVRSIEVPAETPPAVVDKGRVYRTTYVVAYIERLVAVCAGCRGYTDPNLPRCHRCGARFAYIEDGDRGGILTPQELDTRTKAAHDAPAPPWIT